MRETEMKLNIYWVNIYPAAELLGLALCVRIVSELVFLVL